MQIALEHEVTVTKVVVNSLAVLVRKAGNSAIFDDAEPDDVELVSTKLNTAVLVNAVELPVKLEILVTRDCSKVEVDSTKVELL